MCPRIPVNRSSGRDVAQQLLRLLGNIQRDGGEERPVFSTPGSPYLSQFVPSRDGKRFLIRVPIEQPESRPIIVTIDWLRRLSRSH